MEKYIRIPGKRLVITKKMIESAVDNTKSNAQAAKWLGVSFNTYKKWAKFYGLYDDHINQSGIGIKKKPQNYKVTLEDIFNNHHPDYPPRTLKKRLIGEGLMEEECSVCGWNEERITDNKICLTLDYEDGDNNNKSYDNLRLLCSNCYFTNVDNFKSSRNFCY